LSLAQVSRQYNIRKFVERKSLVKHIMCVTGMSAYVVLLLTQRYCERHVMLHTRGMARCSCAWC